MAQRKRFSASFPPGADPGPPLAGMLAELSIFTEGSGLEARAAARLAIVAEELASNAVRHGGARTVGLVVDIGEDRVEIVMEDDGAAFDPSAARPFAGPDPESGGGVGLEMVRSWCDALTYQRDGFTNRIEASLRRR